jgi:hypothetical protein
MDVRKRATSPNYEYGENTSMCTFERETNNKISDCGHCGCGQSTQSGQHGKEATGETVPIGGQQVPTYKCPTCGTYVY